MYDYVYFQILQGKNKITGHSGTFQCVCQQILEPRGRLLAPSKRPSSVSSKRFSEMMGMRCFEAPGRVVSHDCQGLVMDFLMDGSGNRKKKWGSCQKVGFKHSNQQQRKTRFANAVKKNAMVKQTSKLTIPCHLTPAMPTLLSMQRCSLALLPEILHIELCRPLFILDYQNWTRPPMTSDIFVFALEFLLHFLPPKP